jgi:hypothetical protein
MTHTRRGRQVLSPARVGHEETTRALVAYTVASWCPSEISRWTVWRGITRSVVPARITLEGVK